MLTICKGTLRDKKCKSKRYFNVMGGIHLHDVWKMVILYRTCFSLSFITVAFSYYLFAVAVVAFVLYCCIVCISFYIETFSLAPFSLFYDLIASFYTEGKWQWWQGYLFSFEKYHFYNKIFLYICLLLSIQMSLGYALPRIGED